MMKCEDFVKGMVIGLAVGAAAGMMVICKKKESKGMSKMLKTAGTLVENLTDALGL